MCSGYVITLQSLVHNQLSFFYSLPCFRPTVRRKSCCSILKFRSYGELSHGIHTIILICCIVVSMSIVYCRQIEQILVSEEDQNVSNNQTSRSGRSFIVNMKYFVGNLFCSYAFVYKIPKTIDETLYIS